MSSKVDEVPAAVPEYAQDDKKDGEGRQASSFVKYVCTLDFLIHDQKGLK